MLGKRKECVRTVDSVDGVKEICGLRYCFVKWAGLPNFAVSWEQEEKLIKIPGFTKALRRYEYTEEEACKSNYKKLEDEDDALRSTDVNILSSKKTRGKTLKRGHGSEKKSNSKTNHSQAIEKSKGKKKAENIKLEQQEDSGYEDSISLRSHEETKNNFETEYGFRSSLTTGFYTDLIEYYKMDSEDEEMYLDNSRHPQTNALSDYTDTNKQTVPIVTISAQNITNIFQTPNKKEEVEIKNKPDISSKKKIDESKQNNSPTKLNSTPIKKLITQSPLVKLSNQTQDTTGSPIKNNSQFKEQISPKLSHDKNSKLSTKTNSNNEEPQKMRQNSNRKSNCKSRAEPLSNIKHNNKQISACSCSQSPEPKLQNSNEYNKSNIDSFKNTNKLPSKDVVINFLMNGLKAQNIFGKFEDRDGIANCNQPDYFLLKDLTNKVIKKSTDNHSAAAKATMAARQLAEDKRKSQQAEILDEIQQDHNSRVESQMANLPTKVNNAQDEATNVNNSQNTSKIIEELPHKQPCVDKLDLPMQMEEMVTTNLTPERGCRDNLALLPQLTPPEDNMSVHTGIQEQSGIKFIPNRIGSIFQ